VRLCAGPANNGSICLAGAKSTIFPSRVPLYFSRSWLVLTSRKTADPRTVPFVPGVQALG
jgi:hypothetical protein